MDSQLTSYVATSRAAGAADAQIRQALLGAGWPERDVDTALGGASGSGEGTGPAAPGRARRLLRMGVIVVVVLGVLGGGGWAAYANWDSVTAQVKKIVALLPLGGEGTPATPTPSVSVSPTALPSVAPSLTPTPSPAPGLAKFASEAEVRAYLEKVQEQFGASGAGMGGGINMLERAIAQDAGLKGMPPPTAPAAGVGGGSAPAERVSGTNVQVQGVDESDIVKTDGKELYYAHQGSGVKVCDGYTESVQKDDHGNIVPLPVPYCRETQGSETTLLKAFPPDALARDGGIARYGKLLLAKQMLVVLPEDGWYGFYRYGYGGPAQKPVVVGYDVSDPANPKESWKVELGDQTMLVDARLAGEKLYLITRTGLNYEKPCPLVPAVLKFGDLSIPCGDVYHPITPVSVDVTYAVLALNPADGTVQQKLAVMAPSNDSTLVMSQTALYLAYPLPMDQFGFMAGFFAEQGKGLLPDAVLDRLAKLRGYDISDSAKMVEYQGILERAWRGISADERMRLENEMQNRVKSYASAHAREALRTAVVKVNLGTLAVEASGEVPGTLLNQFSMDEHNGYLRAATTIGGRGVAWMLGGMNESVNDVTVLDAKLAEVGSVKDLGKGERIYSARFVGDKGYVVTFRETDPFYVLDLSVPASPRMAGELKIPGYSSYLHPVTKDLVLGVGMEGSQVKVALFDVADPTKPTEAAKYTLAEHWTEVSNTHHAFLLDPKHEAFFMPGSRGGYVFSYKDKKLSLVATVADVRAERAVYLNDYLYVLSPEKIVVFSETDWTKVKELSL